MPKANNRYVHQRKKTVTLPKKILITTFTSTVKMTAQKSPNTTTADTLGVKVIGNKR